MLVAVRVLGNSSTASITARKQYYPHRQLQQQDCEHELPALL